MFKLHLFAAALFGIADIGAPVPALPQAPPACQCRAETGPCLCGNDCRCPPVAKKAPAIVIAPIPAPMPAAGQWVDVKVCNGNGTCRIVRTWVPAGGFK